MVVNLYLCFVWGDLWEISERQKKATDQDGSRNRRNVYCGIEGGGMSNREKEGKETRKYKGN